MKLKKTIIFSTIAIMCLLFMSMSSKAYDYDVKLVGYEVDFPKRVREGKTFDITINFNYPSESHIIYGERANVYLFISLNDNPLKVNTIRRASDYADDLRPESITFTINTSLRGYEEGDIFNFRIKYKSGINTTMPFIYQIIYTPIFVEMVFTEVFEVKIINTNLIDFSFASVLIPLFILATTITLRKIKKGQIK